MFLSLSSKKCKHLHNPAAKYLCCQFVDGVTVFIVQYMLYNVLGGGCGEKGAASAAVTVTVAQTRSIKN